MIRVNFIPADPSSKSSDCHEVYFGTLNGYIRFINGWVYIWPNRHGDDQGEQVPMDSALVLMFVGALTEFVTEVDHSPHLVSSEDRQFAVAALSELKFCYL